MKNENDKWIMDGIDWNNPKCIHTVDEAIAYINKVGFLPLFKNEIPGFSLEERTAEYSRAAEPPVQCGVSHLSRRTEPHCL